MFDFFAIDAFHDVLDLPRELPKGPQGLFDVPSSNLTIQANENTFLFQFLIFLKEGETNPGSSLIHCRSSAKLRVCNILSIFVHVLFLH